MQLRPRYDAEPILVIDNVDSPADALIRQRRRLLATLESLNDEQWQAQSRCDEWTTQGVVQHLATTDQFWGISLSAGLRDEPTRFLTFFDPVASPAQMVRDEGTRTPAEVVARYRNALDGFLAIVEKVSDHDWTAKTAEAPPGHVSLAAAALHALWDGWIHERDIAVPLGLPVVEDDEELALVLRYVAGLSPAFQTSIGSGRDGVLCIESTNPALHLLVHAGSTVRVTDGTAPEAPMLRGKSIDLIEGLSFRAPLDHDLRDDDQWWLQGLAEVFDRA